MVRGRKIPGQGWSPMGRVPHWEETPGPWRPVTVVSRARMRAGRGVAWQLAATHIEAVWGYCYTTSRRGLGDPEPLEFSAKISRHAKDCPNCQTDEALELWGIALRYTHTQDVVKAIRRDRKSG